MKKRIVSTLLTVVLTASMILSGCGNSEPADTAEPSDGAAPEQEEAPAGDGGEAAEGEEASAEATEAPAVSHDEELTLEVYDVAANYQGLQSGWYGKILKDKFNIVLNIIAPQVSGDGEALYQTRTAAGNLGDIILLDNADMLDLMNEGVASLRNGELAAMMKIVSGALVNYEAGNLILTDDKAPVEMLGMRAIDEIIRDEISYYKEIFKRDGIGGLLNSF